MRKGVAATILIFFVLALSVITMANFLSIRSKSATDIYMEDVNTLNSVLLLSKEYSRTALRFSLYQSCYDLLGSGEYLPDEAGFRAMLEDSIEGAMRLYTKDGYYFSEDYRANFPLYNVEIKSAGPDSMTVSMTGKDIIITKEYATKSFGSRTISLTKNSSMQEEVPTDCWKVYQEARAAQEMVESTISEAVLDQLVMWPSGTIIGGGISATTQEGIADALFGALSGKTMAEAEKSISDAIKSISLPEGARLLEPEVNIRWEVISSKPEGGEGTVSASCSFMPEAKVTVEISSEGEKEHPVHDGKGIKMLKLSAKHSVSVSLDADDYVLLESGGVSGAQDGQAASDGGAAPDGGATGGAAAEPQPSGSVVPAPEDEISLVPFPPGDDYLYIHTCFEKPRDLVRKRGTGTSLRYIGTDMMSWPVDEGEWLTFTYNGTLYRIDVKRIDIDSGAAEIDPFFIPWRDEEPDPRLLTLPSSVEIELTGPGISQNYVVRQEGIVMKLENDEVMIHSLYPDFFTGVQLYIRAIERRMILKYDWPLRCIDYGEITEEGAKRFIGYSGADGAPSEFLLVYGNEKFSGKVQEFDYDEIGINMMKQKHIDIRREIECSTDPNRPEPVAEGDDTVEVLSGSGGIEDVDCIVEEGEPAKGDTDRDGKYDDIELYIMTPEEHTFDEDILEDAGLAVMKIRALPETG